MHQVLMLGARNSKRGSLISTFGLQPSHNHHQKIFLLLISVYSYKYITSFEMTQQVIIRVFESRSSNPWIQSRCRKNILINNYINNTGIAVKIYFLPFKIIPSKFFL